MTKRTLYLAHPLGFSTLTAGGPLASLVTALEGLGAVVREPFADAKDVAAPVPGWAWTAARDNVAAVMGADGVFAVVNGAPPDEGVMIEVGMAIAWQKPLFLFRDDVRRCSDSGDYPLNLMAFAGYDRTGWRDYWYESLEDLADPSRGLARWIAGEDVPGSVGAPRGVDWRARSSIRSMPAWPCPREGGDDDPDLPACMLVALHAAAVGVRSPADVWSNPTSDEINHVTVCLERDHLFGCRFADPGRRHYRLGSHDITVCPGEAEYAWAALDRRHEIEGSFTAVGDYEAAWSAIADLPIGGVIRRRIDGGDWMHTQGTGWWRAVSMAVNQHRHWWLMRGEVAALRAAKNRP